MSLQIPSPLTVIHRKSKPSPFRPHFVRLSIHPTHSLTFNPSPSSSQSRPSIHLLPRQPRQARLLLLRNLQRNLAPLGPSRPDIPPRRRPLRSSSTKHRPPSRARLRFPHTALPHLRRRAQQHHPDSHVRKEMVFRQRRRSSRSRYRE